MRLGGRYDVAGKPSAKGVLGAFFKGHDRRLERDVGIKRVDSVADALREARALAAVSGHPGVLAVHDVIEHQGHAWLVTELVNGTPLGDDERCRRRSIPNAIALTVELLHALGHVHAAGHLHTDVKPQNILIPSGKAAPPLKLIDFGGAERKASNGKFRGRSRAGCALYMAPEQFAKTVDLDDTSDVYQAAGVCVYLVSGRSPIDWPDVEGDKAQEAACLPLQLAGHKRSIPDEALAAVLRRALDPNPRRRYRSAQALADALGELPAARGGSVG